ncbi:hypothetical protein [Paenisporosarcina antarctica]|uniref:hypothetical protein n=1 Tax=Paenisporosarcina antarctica TaxID=417367 RepID=UPI001417077F|nr:hypothetical protein [Paenisporosarcina antarctica]
MIGMGITEDEADQNELNLKKESCSYCWIRMTEKRIHLLTMSYTQLKVLLDIKYYKFTKTRSILS